SSFSILLCSLPSYFSFTAPATSPIYTLSLHDALPISAYDSRHDRNRQRLAPPQAGHERSGQGVRRPAADARHRAPPAVAEHLGRSEEHTSELQSPCNLVCRLLLEKKKKKKKKEKKKNRKKKKKKIKKKTQRNRNKDDIYK